MADELDFGVLWPVPAGRYGWMARGNAPCVMEIVSWLSTGTIDAQWPGVSPSIAHYVQAAQDAMDDELRQKLLVLVPALMRLLGDANWWTPAWTRSVLRIRQPEPTPEFAAERAA